MHVCRRARTYTPYAWQILVYICILCMKQYIYIYVCVCACIYIICINIYLIECLIRACVMCMCVWHMPEFLWCLTHTHVSTYMWICNICLHAGALTRSLAIRRCSPPTSCRYFTTSRCPFSQAYMRQVLPSCKHTPSENKPTWSLHKSSLAA